MTRNNLDKNWRLCAGAITVAAAVLAISSYGARAQDEAPTNAPVTGRINVESATAVDLQSAPALVGAAAPAGVNYNRPTPNIAHGGAAPSFRSQGGAPESPSSALALWAQTPSLNETSFGGFPPDGDIATSVLYSVQVNNFAVTIFNTAPRTIAKQVNFATFFSDSANFLFDPRVIYDPTWQRFVVMADGCNGGCPSGAQVSFLDVAISKTSNPTGAYWIYHFGPGTGTGDFADFPQMGMDLNSIIFTFNDFLAGGGFDAKTFAVAKAYLYNGLGFSVPIFGGSSCTIAPPYVLDNGGPSYTLVACPGDNGVYLGPMTNSGLSNVSVQHWQAKVATAAFGSVPCAPQPTVSYCLDTGDSRFENRSAQIGSRIWNVHTVQDGTATPRWYEFDTGASTQVGSGIWFATGTSSDWHPSIIVNGVGAVAPNPTGETFGTWMSVDATNNRNLQLRAIGGSFDNAGAGAGIPVSPLSAQPLTNQTFNGNRSGDYSYISLWPRAIGACAANEFAVLEGEVSLGPNWGTVLGIVKHC